MAVTTGTAANYKDLLDKLRLYLVAQGWTVNAWAPGAGAADPSQLDVMGPGNVGGQQPKIGIQTDRDTVTNAYTWQVGAYPQYNAALGYGQQNNNSPSVNLCLWDNTMEYWFYVNNTRFIVIAKIGTYYMSMYAGFFLPYALPAEYPYPYYVGATYATKQPFNYVNGAMRSFADPGRGAAYYMRRESLTWCIFHNSDQQFNVDDAYYGLTDSAIIWPYRSFFGDNDESYPYDLGVAFFQYMRPPVGGKMPLFQLQIMDLPERVIPGCLDGVFATGGFNRISEQTLIDGPDTYRLFINVYRNTPKGFFAVLEN
jgi:hypothetical protein